MQQLWKRLHTPAGASPGLKKLDVAGLKLLLVIAITVTTCYSLFSSPRDGIAAQSPRGGVAEHQLHAAAPAAVHLQQLQQLAEAAVPGASHIKQLDVGAADAYTTSARANLTNFR
jgi:hypothetical protein